MTYQQFYVLALVPAILGLLNSNIRERFTVTESGNQWLLGSEGWSSHTILVFKKATRAMKIDVRQVINERRKHIDIKELGIAKFVTVNVNRRRKHE